jgi:hypothetical protein
MPAFNGAGHADWMIVGDSQGCNRMRNASASFNRVRRWAA